MSNTFSEQITSALSLFKSLPDDCTCTKLDILPLLEQIVGLTISLHEAGLVQQTCSIPQTVKSNTSSATNEKKKSNSKKSATQVEDKYDQSADTCVVKLTSGPNKDKRCPNKKVWINPGDLYVCTKHKKDGSVKIEADKPVKKATAMNPPPETQISQQAIANMLQDVIGEDKDKITVTNA